MRDEIERVLEERVRPTLRLHGGDIEIAGLEDGAVYLRFLGQCSGCPSAALTTRQLVEEELCAALPGIGRVELVQAVDGDLLRQARAILSHG